MGWRKSSIELITLFRDTMDGYEEADKRKMFGYPCCFLGGNMFTGLHQEDWVLRLPEVEREEFKAAYSAKGFEPMPGRAMKEYVVLPKEVLESDELRHKWVAIGLAYAKSLPIKVPKPRKKKSVK